MFIARHWLLFLVALTSAATARAQTYADTGGPIPPSGALAWFPLEVASPDASVMDTLTYGLEEVCLTMEHTWIGDLDIWLVAPDSTAVQLITAVGYDTDHFANTCLRANEETWIPFGTPPFTGAYTSIGQLGRVNNGQSAAGTWWLRVEDTDPYADSGAVLNWSIRISNAPAGYQPFSTSVLPLLEINTPLSHVPDTGKVTGFLRIIDNGPGILNHLGDVANIYHGSVGIERRGHSSQDQPKRPYSIELRNAQGEDLNASLLGMPAESDWVLDAVYLDKSAARNAFSYDLARRMGNYAPRTRHVDLVLDGEHQGVYVLTEKVKRGADRVDIAKLSEGDTLMPGVSGGYIVKIDRQDRPEIPAWDSDHPPPHASSDQEIRFLFEYPSSPHDAQADYIEDFIDEFEDALAASNFTDPGIGYKRHIDMRSFIDYFIITELSRNVDGYRRSAFVHKQATADGGKLFAGPLWDMDLSWGHADFCGATEVAGWAYQFGMTCPEDRRQVPFWWARLLEDVAYRDSLRCRWDELRNGTLATKALLAMVDSIASSIATAQDENFLRWPTLGHAIWPEPSPAPDTWAGEVDEVKDWIIARSYWMDEHLPALVNGCTFAGMHTEQVDSLSIWPNPFTDEVNVSYFAEHGEVHTLEVCDALGRVLRTATWTSDFSGQVMRQVDLRALTPAPYVLRVIVGSRSKARVLVRL